MTSKLKLSKCHEAPCKLVGGIGDFSDHEEGITMHYECTECGQPCDFHIPNEKAIKDVYKDNADFDGSEEILIPYEAIEEILAAHHKAVTAAYDKGREFGAATAQAAQKSSDMQVETLIQAAYERGRIAEAKVCQETKSHDAHRAYNVAAEKANKLADEVYSKLYQAKITDTITAAEVALLEKLDVIKGERAIGQFILAELNQRRAK